MSWASWARAWGRAWGSAWGPVGDVPELYQYPTGLGATALVLSPAYALAVAAALEAVARLVTAMSEALTLSAGESMAVVGQVSWGVVLSGLSTRAEVA
jgi:hypothetical protein